MPIRVHFALAIRVRGYRLRTQIHCQKVAVTFHVAVYLISMRYIKVYLKSLNIASYLASYSVKDFFSLDHIKYRKLKDYT